MKKICFPCQIVCDLNIAKIIKLIVKYKLHSERAYVAAALFTDF